MKARGQTPVITPSPRETAEADVNRLASEIQSSYRLGQLRNNCLRRDGYRCVVTGFYDRVAASMVDVPDDAMSDDTECAHIIPFSFGGFGESEVCALPFLHSKQ